MKVLPGNVFPQASARSVAREEQAAIQGRVSIHINIERKPVFSQAALEVASLVAGARSLHPATRKSMLRLVAMVDEHLTGPQKERYLAMIAAMVVIIESLAAQNNSKSYKPWSLEKAVAYMEEVREQMNPEAYADIKVQIDIEFAALQTRISTTQNTVCRLV